MKHACVALMLCLLTLGIGADLDAKEKVWVSSADAAVKADKSASSATVESLSVGTELQVLSFDGRWYQVRTSSGKTGWVYRGKVSNTPPPTGDKSKPDALGGLIGGLSGSSIRAGTADTSRSIRGLSPEAKEYARSSGTPEAYQQALDRVLNFRTDKEAVEAFLKTGKIGEYAP